MKQIITTLFLFFCLLGTGQEKNRVIDSLERLIPTLKDSNRIFAEKATLLLKYYTSGDQIKAADTLSKTFAEAEKQNSEFGLGAMYNAKGTLYYYESKFDSAKYCFEKAIELRKKVKDNEGALKSLSNLAGMYYMRNEYKKSLSLYEEGLKMESNLNYEEGELIRLNNIGYIHNTLKIYDKALLYFRKAEKSLRRKNNFSDLIYTYDGISLTYKDLNIMDSALYYANKAKDLAIRTNEQFSLSYEYHAIGAIYLSLKKYDQAKENFQRALEICKTYNDKRLELTIYANMAIVEMENNNLDNSFIYLEKLMKLRKELNIIVNIEDQPKLFAEYYSRKKNFEKAYEYIQQYIGITDSLYKSDIALQLNEMRSKYESDKKEKENQLLQIENKNFKQTRNYLLIILGIAFTGIVGGFFAYKKIKNANSLLGIQKQVIEEKQKEILDSINYAKRIQYALLASDSLLSKHLPEHFVLFKPKDVVSGDFYWAAPTSSGFLYVTGDCTGHGVPGAFMSLLNITKLNQVVNENNIHQPDKVLNQVRKEIIQALNPKDSEIESKDGMDAVLCKLDLKKMKLEYASANNSFYIVRNGELIVCRADKMSVGKGHDDSIPFTYNEIELQKGDTIYTFTDGFADQFGGIKGKKFMYKKLSDYLLSINHEPMDLQKQKLKEQFESWKGSLEQVDDVCVIGVRV